MYKIEDPRWRGYRENCQRCGSLQLRSVQAAAFPSASRRIREGFPRRNAFGLIQEYCTKKDSNTKGCQKKIKTQSYRLGFENGTSGGAIKNPRALHEIKNGELGSFDAQCLYIAFQNAGSGTPVRHGCVWLY